MFYFNTSTYKQAGVLFTSDNRKWMEVVLRTNLKTSREEIRRKDTGFSRWMASSRLCRLSIRHDSYNCLRESNACSSQQTQSESEKHSSLRP